MQQLPSQDPGVLASVIFSHQGEGEIQELVTSTPAPLSFLLLLESSREANYPVWTFPAVCGTRPEADTLK